MTSQIFTTSQSQAGAAWNGAAGDYVLVEAGVTLTDTAASGSATLTDSSYGSAEIDGTVIGPTAIDFAGAAGQTTTVDIAAAGFVLGLGGQGVEIGAGSYAITNAGEITTLPVGGSGGDGVDVAGPGTLTNDGKITAATDGVFNNDSNAVSADYAYLYNNGAISGALAGVYDSGAHIENIYNSGAIDGVSQFSPSLQPTDGAIYATSTVTDEDLTNTASGVISGGVNLYASSDVVNEGAIDRVYLDGVDSTLVNSGTIGAVHFDTGASTSSIDNSGMISLGLIGGSTALAATNSGTIAGGVYLGGAGSSMTDSGAIEDGLYIVGGVGGAAASVTIESGGVLSSAVGAAALTTPGNYDLTNSGEIVSTASATNQPDGVDLDGAGLLTNNGKIEAAAFGVWNKDTTGGFGTLVNHGLISGDNAGVYDSGSASGAHQADIENFGAISTGGVNAVLSDQYTSEVLDNAGTITNDGAFGAVDLLGYAVVTNSGLIEGGVDLAGAGSSLADSGTIKGGVEFAGAATGATTDASITSAGVITSSAGNAGLDVLAGAYDIRNSGEISTLTPVGAAKIPDGVDVFGAGEVVNDGKIEAAGIGVNNGDTATADTAYVYNHGLISGNGGGVSDSGGHLVVLYNYGAIDGGAKGNAVWGDTTQGEIIYNSGTIAGSLTGAIVLSGGASKIKNSGLIGGGVTIGGAASSLANSGTIQDQVYFSGNGASVTDSGTIAGGLKFSGASGLATTQVIVTSSGVVSAAFGSACVYVESGTYLVKNSGDITAEGAAVQAHGVYAFGAGKVVNNGKIEIAGIGVLNNDATAADTAYVYNHGLISGDAGGVDDAGGHHVVIYNYGSIDGGAGGDAVSGSTSAGELIYNTGAIGGSLGGAIALKGGAAVVHNFGSIDGSVTFGAGSTYFLNHGVVDGKVTFSGTGNVFNGAGGSVTGTIYGAGANGVYYAGADGETFDFTASGAGFVKGGGGDDTFIFTIAGLTASTTIRGGLGTADDTLKFSTAGGILESSFAHVTGIETIDLANGVNDIGLDNAMVNSANGASLTVNGGSSADNIAANNVTNSNDHVQICGGGGADTIEAGAAHNTFVYKSVGDSASTKFDTIYGVNFAHDLFDVSAVAGGVESTETVSGPLNGGANFNANLAAVLGQGKADQLVAGEAALFTATSGADKGQEFLVIGSNGTTGYVAGADLVIRFGNGVSGGATGTMTIGNFI